MMKTMKPVTAGKAFGEVLRHAEKIKNDGDHQVAVMDVGDMWAQGDVGIVRVERVPVGATLAKSPSPQLAPGATQGSRHCIADLSTCRLYTVPNATPLDGPVIEAPAGLKVEHPEHGDVTLPAGTYAVVYQRAFADELRAVQD